jgi:hypothetical protein
MRRGALPYASSPRTVEIAEAMLRVERYRARLNFFLSRRPEQGE